jgi:hypothetical protein
MPSSDSVPIAESTSEYDASESECSKKSPSPETIQDEKEKTPHWTPRPSALLEEYATLMTESDPLEKRAKKKVRRDIQTQPSITPRFISGHANGQPVYTTVRVRTQQEVTMIEHEIAQEEK